MGYSRLRARIIGALPQWPRRSDDESGFSFLVKHEPNAYFYAGNLTYETPFLKISRSNGSTSIILLRKAAGNGKKIAGVYGMNFRNMPELEWPYAYPLVLLVMLAVVIVIFIWFKRRKIL